MNRFPSGDELRYKSIPPKPSRFWNWVMSGYRRNLIRNSPHKVFDYEFQEIERLQKLVDSGARLLIAPNHSDHADGLALYRLAEEVDTMFCHMATHHLFEGHFGLRYFIFPRVGVFPIEREGSALGALKAAKDVLIRIAKPLVVYPEGEVYHTSDRLTPLREGAAAMALTSQKALKDEAPVYVVPVALKYRYLEPKEALERVSEKLSVLEEKFTWVSRPEQSLPRRIYRFASGLLALKEVEFLGSPASGTVPQRVENLRDKLVQRLELRYLGKLGTDSLPERVTVVQRGLVERIRDRETSEESRKVLRRDLDVLFLTLQLFSYPGDYIHEYPTVERVAETLVKFEQDLGDREDGYPEVAGPRRLTFRIGEPIDVREFAEERNRVAVPAITNLLAERLQTALDELGPGTLISDVV